MVQTLNISLERPITSARILTEYGSSSENSAAQNNTQISAELSRQTKSFMQAAAAVSAIAVKLNSFLENELRQHNQQIAKLAVEIARKVLMQEIADGHYKIETILQEAIRNAPSRENISVRLNPVDAAFCRQAQEQNPDLFSTIKIEGDPCVKPADCIVATPKGLVESFTETHLLHIAEALAHTE